MKFAWNGGETDTASCAPGILVYIIKKGTFPAALVDAVAAEIKTRISNGTMRQSGILKHWLVRNAKSFCACGRVALYVVNDKGFCKRCRDGALNMRIDVVKAHERKSADIAQDDKDFDTRDARRRRLHQTVRAHKMRRR